MEERRLNEKESLELITRMIQNSKRNLAVGSGNVFLLWGYLSAVVSLLVLGAVWQTGHVAWHALWGLIPLVGWPVQWHWQRREAGGVVTYTDKALAAVWRTVGILGMLGCLGLALYADDLSLMIPGAILLIAVGTAITGALMQDRFMEYSVYCSLGLTAAVWAFCLENESSWPLYHVLFSLCAVTMMVLPGHRMNKETKKRGAHV